MARLRIENISEGNTFSERFRYLRAVNHVTRKQVAETLGTSISCLDRYTMKERNPSEENLAKLADYFGVSIDYLIGRRETPEKPKQEKCLEEYSAEESEFLTEYKLATRKTQEIIKGMINGATKEI